MDERSRALHVAVADKLRRHPALWSAVGKNLQRWLADSPQPSLIEWQQILAGWPQERILDFLSSDAEAAARLRQSSPFAGILSPRERNAILAEYEAR